jgi:hypothetical protein
MTEITAADSSIRIVVAVINGSYEAKLGEDGKTLTGTWSQNGIAFPLTLTKK